MNYLNKENHLRKKKSMDRLHSLGIECDELLSVLPTTDKIMKVERGEEEILNRFLCSYFASMISFIKISLRECPDETHFATEDLNNAMHNIEKFNLYQYMTTEEKSVIDNIDDLNILVSPLKTESSYILGWILGINKQLHIPNKVCDLFFLDVLLSRIQDRTELQSYVHLKDIQDIIDEYDFEYRCSYVLFRQEGSKKTIIENLNPDIVWERRLALEWFVGNLDDWDSDEIPEP